jgi:hypothetical protein
VIYRKLSNYLRQPYFCNSGSDSCVVEYELSGQKYKFLLKKETILGKPRYFILHKRQDITSELKPWIGPNHDFHNSKLTPSDIGYEELTVFFSIGDKKCFGKNDVLPVLLK